MRRIAKLVLLVAGSTAAWMHAQENNATLIVELHDDDTEEGTFQSAAPISEELWRTAFLAAGCEGGQGGEAGSREKFTCRHAMARYGFTISSWWDFAPLANGVGKSGAGTLTTCIYLPNWPYAVN